MVAADERTERTERTERIEVTGELAGARLDRLIAQQLGGVSRARAKALFLAQAVTVVDGEGRRRRVAKGERAVAGTVLEVRLPAAVDRAAAVADPEAAAGLLTVLAESDHWVAVDKPAGIPSAPLTAGERGTMANALVARYPEMRDVGYGPREPGLVHRLDTGTSGVLVAARSTVAFAAVTAALKAGAVDKRYLLVCSGASIAAAGEITLPLAADPKNRRRVRACRDEREVKRLHGRAATTRYQVLRRVGELALVEAHAPRAQRHQIRAHLAALGAPLIGDTLYGGAPWAGHQRHALHASAFRWDGAAGVAALDVTAPLPADLAELLEG